MPFCFELNLFELEIIKNDELVNQIEQIPGVFEMTTEKSAAQHAENSNEARILLDEAWDRAKKAHKEATKQAEIVYKEAKEMAGDKEARKAVDQAHKEAKKQVDKVRDAIVQEAHAVFSNFWKQREIDDQAAITSAKERTDQAKKDYKEDKERADIVYKEAKNTAVGKEAREAADQTHKESMKQAKKGRNDVTT